MSLTTWMANRWDDAARADLARRWIAGETQQQIGESLNTTASTVCHQIMHFCNDWTDAHVQGHVYADNRRAVALVALRNYFFAVDEPLVPSPVWRRFDRYNITDEDYFAARREHMWLLRAEGVTYTAIGKRCSITGGRARQIINRFGREVRRSLRGARFRWEETPRRD